MVCFLSMVAGRVVKRAGSGKTILLSFDELVAVSLLVLELQETAILQEIKVAFKVISEQYLAGYIACGKQDCVIS